MEFVMLLGITFAAILLSCLSFIPLSLAILCMGYIKYKVLKAVLLIVGIYSTVKFGNILGALLFMG